MPLPGVHRLDVGEELLEHEGALGQVDQVRAVVGGFSAERGGGGEEAGMSPHHHADVHAGQRGIIEVGAGEGLRDEARGRRETGRVVVADQVVVDGLRDVDAAQRVAGLLRFEADDAHRVGRVVAADVEKVFDLVRAQHVENLLAVGDVGLVAGRAERRRRRRGDQFEVGGGLLGQVDELFVDDAAHAMQGAVYARHLGKAARFEHHARERLVDHGGRAASLGDENFSG